MAHKYVVGEGRVQVDTWLSAAAMVQVGSVDPVNRLLVFLLGGPWLNTFFIELIRNCYTVENWL